MAHSEERMFFEQRHLVRGFRLEPPDESIEFQYGGELRIRVQIQSKTQDVTQERDARHSYCTVLAEHEPPALILSLFGKLSQGNWPELIKDKVTLDKIRQTLRISGMDENDPGYVPGLSLLDLGLQDFIRNIETEMRKACYSTIEVLRWRTGFRGPHAPLSSSGSHFSFDSKDWRLLPGDHDARLVDEDYSRKVPETIRKEVPDLVLQGISEPLAHELFREAWGQRSGNRRSSLVIGFAAAEAGFKHLVSELAPQAAWLIEEGPTPSLPKMLSNYLPQLAIKNTIEGVKLPPTQSIRKAIQDCMEARNSVAHIGKPPPSIEQLEEWLYAIRDLLWLFDYYRGFSWAWDFIQESTRQELLETAKKGSKRS